MDIKAFKKHSSKLVSLEWRIKDAEEQFEAVRNSDQKTFEVSFSQEEFSMGLVLEIPKDRLMIALNQKIRKLKSEQSESQWAMQKLCKEYVKETL